MAEGGGDLNRLLPLARTEGEGEVSRDFEAVGEVTEVAVGKS